MGRQSKLTPDLKQRIIELISAGQTQETACRLVGISRRTLWEWLRQGENQSHGRYREFFDRYQKALADADIPLVRAVRRRILGGVWMLPVYGEDGNRMVDKQGKPKVRRKTLLPNGRLALRLLALRNPRDWGGKADPDLAAMDHSHRPRRPPGKVINVYEEAVQWLRSHGIDPLAGLPDTSKQRLAGNEDATKNGQGHELENGAAGGSFPPESHHFPATKPRSSSKIGRPSKLTPTRKQRIIETISAGETQETACRLAGIPRRTLWEWLRRGQDESHGTYREFYDRYQKALADAEILLVKLVRRRSLGGVWTLPVYDEYGNRLVDEQGKPMVRRVTLKPDGRLALKLLALRNPRDWGGKAEPDVAVTNRSQRPELSLDEEIKLVNEAIQILVNYNAAPFVEYLPGTSEKRPGGGEDALKSSQRR